MLDTLGNVYTTMLHVINSACIKLGKLTSAAKVYRGISGRHLPKLMHEADKYNVRGGVEFGFMSCTLDRRVAMHYASGRKDQSAVLFEMQMGMIDRGAELSWISQYPHEREILCARAASCPMATRPQLHPFSPHPPAAHARSPCAILTPDCLPDRARSRTWHVRSFGPLTGIEVLRTRV